MKSKRETEALNSELAAEMTIGHFPFFELGFWVKLNKSGVNAGKCFSYCGLFSRVGCDDGYESITSLS